MRKRTAERREPLRRPRASVTGESFRCPSVPTGGYSSSARTECASSSTDSSSGYPGQFVHGTRQEHLSKKNPYQRQCRSPSGGSSYRSRHMTGSSHLRSVRCVAALNCHMMLPPLVGFPRLPTPRCRPCRAVLPSAAAEILDLLPGKWRRSTAHNLFFNKYLDSVGTLFGAGAAEAEIGGAGNPRARRAWLRVR